MSRPASSYCQPLPVLPAWGQETQDRCLLLPLSIQHVMMLSKINVQKERGGTPQSLTDLDLTGVVGFMAIKTFQIKHVNSFIFHL